MNENVREFINQAIEKLENAIDKINTDNLGNDKNYIEITNIISKLEGLN